MFSEFEVRHHNWSARTKRKEGHDIQIRCLWVARVNQLFANWSLVQACPIMLIFEQEPIQSPGKES